MRNAVVRLPYVVLKYLHVLGAITILGTGAGIAFFMLMAHLSRDAAIVAHTAGVVVIADAIFTATAVLVQPITGVLLMHQAGFTVSDGWLAISVALYAVAVLLWLPVIWIQIRMRDLARAASAIGERLPPAYHCLFRIWFVFGIPGFGSVMLILWLMIAKPFL